MLTNGREGYQMTLGDWEGGRGAEREPVLLQLEGFRLAVFSLLISISVVPPKGWAAPPAH